ncbi:hypothetical protein [Pareuzebyella sediminis]|uniref:hypothetical protein n=1 Tax=Pareuzebyella sediminis TaxID=2607998 RepID=UPI0011F07182|nr:hypothetical protein [Pareuzebyella sediminis]
MKNKPINLDKETIEIMIKDATMKALGYIKVANSGGCYALVEKGIYTVEKQGHIVQLAKNRKALFSIFQKLVWLYKNFERDGYYYNYDRGTWWVTKMNTVKK